MSHARTGTPFDGRGPRRAMMALVGGLALAAMGAGALPILATLVASPSASDQHVLGLVPETVGSAASDRRATMPQGAAPAPAPLAEVGTPGQAPTPATPPPGTPPPPPPPPAGLDTLPPLPPPPVLILPPMAKPNTVAADADLAVADFRAAVRSKQALRAEAILSSIPSDQYGYRDMVSMLAKLKGTQDGLFGTMRTAAAAGHIAELMPLVVDATAYPELATAVAQSKAYVYAATKRWQAALERAEAAQKSGDLSSAQALIAEVPSDPAILPDPIFSRRKALNALLSATHKP